jgi:hypothetical protein
VHAAAVAGNPRIHPRLKETIMNKLLVAAALVATTLSAFAQGEASYEYPQPAVSNITRGEVRAETARAAASGEIVSGERSFVAQDNGRALSRAEVRSALAQAQANGEIVGGEASVVAQAGAAPAMLTASR